MASLDANHVRLGFEVAIALLLAVQGVRLVLVLAAPMPVSTDAGSNTSAPTDLAILQNFDPFFRDGAADETAEAETGALILFGVRVGGQDGGSAIVGLADGTQVFASVGEPIDGDAVLESVAYDHIVLVRGGARTRLTFDRPADIAPQEAATPSTPAAPLAGPIGGSTGAAPPRTAAARGPGGTTAAPTASPAVTPTNLMSGATFRPRMRGLGIQGFTVGSSGDGSALRALGLQSGDVILSVNGTELNSLGRIGKVKTDLQSATSAEIRYERDGETRTLTLGAPR